MNSIPKSRFGKLLVGTTLSLTIAFSAGAMFTNAHSAYAATASASIADNVIATGKQFLGVPYQFGAKSNRTDVFDCSSFTQYVFKQNGISIPRSSKQQSNVGTFVPRDQLQPGDLIFSDTNRDGVINHVSLYIGNGQLLHTYRVGIGVTISKFAGSTWDRTYVTARRVLPSNGQPVVVTPPTSTPPTTIANPAPQPGKKAVKHPVSHRHSNRDNQEGEH
ncbi:C40 family peptidase [Cohnella silvisoli]|uniref:C40 family peptidase n=1 Tax=Cohnella silvisoli TaxID=2873699 RepID=A0ABV1KYD1_9BACL|nr:C40 family peptidase [Cohnella silvisoli]MCD9026526.1 C40 family peptidase [Cohnella silvisoli]